MMDKSDSFPNYFAASNPKKALGPDPELMELLWQNGQVVMNSQTHRRFIPSNESKLQKLDHPSKFGVRQAKASSFSHEDETAPWLQSPLEDSFERDFCSNFLYDIPNFDAIKEIPPQEVRVKSHSSSKQSGNHAMAEASMLPAESQVTDTMTRIPNFGSGRVTNFAHFSRLYKSGEQEKDSNLRKELGETSMMTVGSSHCGSNQVQIEADLSRASDMLQGPIKLGIQKMASQSDRGETDTAEPAVTSSSGGSGSSLARIGKQTDGSQNHKRKGRDGDESECQSQETEYEYAEASKPASRSTSARRRRAAEVHNLSERRRRDRINEKMRALQELIPHSNKSDKASMLDEAIEYLKSLQLQVQIMWMGSGVAPMMYPGLQHYLSRMGMPMGPSSMPSMNGHLQMPRAPVVDQSIASAPATNQHIIYPSPFVNPTNFQNQIQDSGLPDSYAQYLRFHQAQMRQVMSLFPYGSLETNQATPPPLPRSNNRAFNRGVSVENGLSRVPHAT